jgi:hypothetical protein
LASDIYEDKSGVYRLSVVEGENGERYGQAEIAVPSQNGYARFEERSVSEIEGKTALNKKLAKMYANANAEQDTLFQKAAEESIFKADEQTAQKFKNEVNRVVDDNKISTSTLIDMGSLPPVFKAVGLSEKQLKTNKFALLKAEGKAGKNPHKLSRKVIEELPALVADPIAIFKSLPDSENPSGYVAVLNARDKDGNQALAIISPSKDGKGYAFLPTAYGKSNFSNFVKKNLRQGMLLYKKNKDFEKAFAVQSGSSANQNPNNRIQTKEDIVKGYRQGPRDMTQTPAFKKWFGDSKVVDGEGRPLVVYHGQDVKRIEIFDNSKGERKRVNLKNVFFFTNDLETAETYSMEDYTTAAWLKIENPYIADFGGTDLARIGNRTVRPEVLAAEIKAEGKHDGIIMKNIKDASDYSIDTVADNYVVFSSNQIKHIENKGTFEGNNIFYQGGKETEQKNLLMATAVKSPHLNEILKTNELIAPSFSITKKGQTELNEGNFGDLLFIRRPESIDFKKDNIYDGDIYSPRLPEPIYMLNGVAYNDTYGEPATKAIINNPKTRKVFFDGFTPMGSRRYKAYTAREIIKSFKKDGLVKGEGFNYGLSSFIAAFRNKLSTKKAVKQAGETKLSDREENKKHYNELSKKSDMLVEEFYPYLKHQDEGYATFYELLEEVNNKNEKGIEELARWDKVPRELKEKADKFTEYAKKLSVSYFEAKPLRAVALSEFGKVLAEKGKLTGEQKKKLQRQGIEIIEYTQGNIAAEIKKIEQEGDMYFQGENGGGEIPSQQLRGNDREGAAEGMTGKKEGTAGSGAGNEPRGIKGFFGDIKEEIKNLLQGKRGAYDPADNIIYMTPDSDASTMLHEFAHYFLKQRWEYILNGKADEAYIKDFAPIKEFLEIKDGQKELSAEQQEKFASAWEDYLATGEAPSAALKKAFERLKQWFLKIYGELRAKAGFELPKEVRAYFDAMLASEEEIKEMNEALTPQLEIKEKTEEEKKIAAFVKDAWDRAKRAAAQKLFARKQEAAEKIKPQEYLDEEARFEEQRYNELVEEKGYRASEALGELTEKDPKELAREYVDEGKISAEDYATAELTAKAHGFDGVDNLLGWIRVSPTFRERLQSDVEEYMAKWEGEHLKAGDLENNLDIAGDDAYLEAMAAEYLAIKNAQEKTKFNLEAARALAQRARVLAKEILAGMPAKRAARLNAYWRLMGKFNAQARAAYGRKDYAKAREHKNAALINAALGREAARIKKQFEKDLAYLKNLAHRPKERFKNQSAFNQIGYVLSRLGIKLKGYNAENGRENISEWAARLSEKNGEADIYITELINEQTYNWTWDLNRIKAADLDEFISTLKSMVRATNAEDRMGKDFEYAKVSDTAARLEKVLRETVSDETRAKNAEKIQARARRMVDVPAKWVSMITRTLTLLKIADGNKDGGLFEQIFYTPVKRAQDRQDVYLRAFQREYRELVEGTYTREELREIANKVSYQEPLGGSLTKAQIIAMALNTGNEMNKERLYNNPIFEYRPQKDGPAWGESVVWDILNANMGKKDWEFVQAAWDMINKPWEEVAQMEERVSGFRPQKVEAAPFMANTADGQTVYLRGGYYPLKYDGRSSETLASREVDSGALAREMKAAIQQTKHGHTERRAQNPGYPLSLNMDIIGQHMAQVYHDLAFREVIISLRKLLNNATAINAIKNNLGPDAYQLLKKYVADAAVDEVNIHANTPVATMVNWLRKNATIAGLCLRLSVVLQNLANVGILPGAVDGFGPQQTWATALKAKSFVLDLAFDGASARELREFVYGKSPMMQSRAEKGFDFTMRQLKQTKLFENNQKLLEFGNAAMVFTDNVWAVPAWQVAYEQGLEMYGYFDAAKTEAQMSEAEQKAIDRADKLIANTIGTGRKIDASQFTRSSDTMTRALNMFYSFMEVMANRWLGETNAVINQKDYARFLGFAGAQLIVFVTMSELLSGRAPEKWEPKEILKWYTAALVDYTSGMVPILRDVAPYFADKVLGNPTYGYSPSPLISSAENIMIRPLEAMLGKKTSAQNVGESITRAAAYALPYPDQFNGLFWNAYDMTINGMTPRLSDLYRRRPKKERK